MNLLLDTHALLWWLNGDPLAPEARIAVADPSNRVCVSSASIWEIAIKQSIGKLEVEGSIAAAAIEDRFEPLPVTFEHAEAVPRLPSHHRDPFDRLLIAQAQVEALTIVTRNARIPTYDVPTLAC